MIKTIPILLIFWLLLVPNASAASLVGFSCEKELSTESGVQLVDKVEKSYSSIKDVTASFVQYSYFAGLSRGEISKGEVKFKKPGMMDWQYAEPTKQRFVADGKTLYYFQPDDNQVTLGDFSNSFQSDLPVSFLLGVGELRKQFNIESSCKSAKGILLQLTPKAEQDFESFKLLVSENKHMPIGAQIIDVGGNETTISLVGLKVNNHLSNQSFDFEIPKGVDIIDRRELRQIEVPRPIVSKELIPTATRAEEKAKP